MRIHCDQCGVEIEKAQALVVELDDEVLYFCSDECLEEGRHHETMHDPDREDGTSAPDIR